jgi:hypothetical protein
MTMNPAPGCPLHASNGWAVPEFLRIVVAEDDAASDRTVAEQSVLALNSAMMVIYDEALAKYRQNLRRRVPIILALFTGEGGRMILYRPGHDPLVADPVPIAYQLAKSVGHSSMAVYQLVAPYLAHTSDRSWQAPMRAYRARNAAALDNLEALDLPDGDREVLRALIECNLAFMDACLRKGRFAYHELEAFARGCAPHAARTIGIAARAQVGHWMGVVAEWKAMLGDDWDRAYAVSNSLYVTRQNNILFTILAQFMGQGAIGDRLLLIETPEFTTTPETLLDLLTRIVADRGIGQVFFQDYYLMDAELLGSGARQVIEQEVTRRGMTPLLPPLAPFHSNDWPWRTDPTKGKGPATLEEALSGSGSVDSKCRIPDVQ